MTTPSQAVSMRVFIDWIEELMARHAPLVGTRPSTIEPAIA
ncbi:hypothetical protein [Roseateles sp. MS654]